MKIFDRWVDFVNLRSETYSEESRIPQIEIGTPLEDARRRDLTINSLFYNINEKKIEDFTTKGLYDLSKGLIRTPLAPLITFLDDPLRVLRAIRFASRLNFSLDEELMAAVRTDQVLTAFSKKISRERIGKEFEGMLKTKNPDLALQYIQELGLFDAVFKLPPNSDFSFPSLYQKDSVHKLRQIHHFIQLYCDGEMNQEARQRLLLASLFKLFRKSTYPVKKNRHPVSVFVIKESIKLPAKCATEVLDIHTHCDTFHSIISRAFGDGGSQELNRKEVGLLLRSAGPAWKEALFVGMIDEFPPLTHHIHVKTLKAGLYVEQIADEGIGTDEGLNRRNRAWGMITQFCKRVEELGLIGVWDLRPFVTGPELGELLGIPPGPKFGKAVQAQIEWLLEHPTGTKEECIVWLKSIKDTL